MGVFDTIKSWFGSTPEAPPAQGAPAMVGRPMPASLPEAERIKQAWYRLDAIKRYILQESQDLRHISEEKRMEFLKEFHQRVAFLLSRGQITQEEIAEYELIIKGA